MSARPLGEALRARSFRRDRLAWIAFVAGVVAIGWGGHAWLHRRVPLEPSPLTRADFRLAVVAYDRVARDGADRHLPVERLEEHLEALRAEGFQPVTLGQVRDAYATGAPLPERPLLLTFDGGHLATHRAVDPLLRRLRWPAVMFLDPHLPEARHPAYAYWDRLRRMVASGLWEVGILGRRPEAAALLEDRLPGHEVLASARGGAAAGEDPGGPVPPLGFEYGLFGVNDRDADPLRLARVRVHAEWSGRELAQRLEHALEPPRAPSGAPAAVAPGRWVASIGEVRANAAGVLLSGGPRAEVWLAGSEWARDFVFEAEVRPERGAFWIVQQAVGSKEQWRWGGNDQEQVLYLQRARPGQPIEVVSKVELGGRPGAWHRVRVVKRGGGVWVEWDGERVPHMPRRVAARWRGTMGLATGSPTTAGRLAIRNARFAALPYRLRPVGPSPTEDEVRRLLDEAEDVAAISPPGLVQEGAAWARRPANRELLSVLAAHGAWDLVPTVELTVPGTTTDEARAVELADVAAQEGWSGVRLVAPPGSPEPPAAWRRVFARRGLRLVQGGTAGPEEGVP